MALSRKLALNSLALLAGNIVSSVISFFVSVFLVRYLGPAEYGRYSVVAAYLSFFHILTGAAIDTILIRDVSVKPESEDLLAGQAFLLRSFLSLAAVAVSWAVLPFMGYDSDVGLWIHIASLGLLFTVRSVFLALFQARLKVIDYVLPELFLGVAFNLLLVLAIFRKVPITIVVVIQTANLGALALAVPVLARLRLGFRLRIVVDLPLCRRLLGDALPLMAALFFISMMLRIDQILIYRILGPAQLGLYSSAVRIAELFTLIPNIFSTVVYPVMCSAFVGSQEYFRKVYSRSMKYMGAVVFPLAVGGSLLSGKILVMLYGKDFLPSGSAFAWLMCCEVFTFLGTIYGNALNAMGMQRLMMIYSGIGLLLNVALNLLLIPRFGIAGAAFASFCSYGAVITVLQLVHREIRPYVLEYFRASALPLVASGCMALFLHFVGGGWSLWAQIVAGAFVYFPILLLMGNFDREDKEYLLQILRLKE